jgi:hypothetical protein
MALDQPEPDLITLGRFASGSHRFIYNPDSTVHWHIELESARSWLPRDRVLRAGALVITRGAAGLELRTRDGALRFPARTFLGPYLRAISSTAYTVLPPAAHTPRVTLDNLVVCRESWRFPGADMRFAGQRDPRERYAWGVNFARAHRLPRWMFYRIPGERKPVYLDWQSPPYVEMFCAAARAACAKQGEVAMTEMLPTPDQAWLTDADGRRYTCELRIAAVDSRGADGGSRLEH